MSNTPDTPTAAPDGPGGGDLTVTHTNTDGTLVIGTRRGDGSRDVLKAAGFRWSRHLGAWFMPQTRGRPPRYRRIDEVTAALEAAGFTVTVEIERYDAAKAFEALQAAGEDRADALDGKAAREKGRANRRYEAAEEIGSMIPMGQPILDGHHSEGHHRRDLARARGHSRAGFEHSERSERAAGRAQAARAQAARREDPVVMGRKVKRLEALQRKLPRLIADALRDGEELRHQQLCDELEIVAEDLRFLRAEIAASGVRQYTPEDFTKGDMALIRREWRLVMRVNKKTLAVQTAYSWTQKYPYHEVTGHRGPTQDPAA
ncbi:MAG TPA: DUF3560 domain-containing protein [Solirubrobacteraceae bacterium]|nr:DUF3560 domain-containing protein [Solirubrobacteraceae bacterium]